MQGIFGLGSRGGKKSTRQVRTCLAYALVGFAVDKEGTETFEIFMRLPEGTTDAPTRKVRPW